MPDTVIRRSRSTPKTSETNNMHRLFARPLAVLSGVLLLLVGTALPALT